MSKELLKGNVPSLILAVLQDGPLHGYGIVREIERRSDGELTFKEGTLYPALHALEADGLVQASWETPEKGPARKTYTLTPEGQDDLKRRRTMWNTFSQAVTQIIGATNGGVQDAKR